MFGGGRATQEQVPHGRLVVYLRMESPSKVQARMQGYERPTIAAIKYSNSAEIDIPHGEWAFFAIVRIGIES